MIIGIDLGNKQFSFCLAIRRNKSNSKCPRQVTNSFLISIDNGTVLIGEPALNRMMIHPELTIANFKRYMDTDKVYKLENFSFRPEELS